MHYARLFMTAFFAFTATGCSNLPMTTDEGGCKVFQRPGYARKVSVQSSQVQHFNALLEFPSPHFNAVVLRSPDESSQLRDLGIWMTYHQRGSTDSCAASAQNQHLWLCTVLPADMARSGFALEVSAPVSLPAEEIIEATKQYWNSHLACKDPPSI
jgi:hypothetical protein